MLFINFRFRSIPLLICLAYNFSLFSQEPIYQFKIDKEKHLIITNGLEPSSISDNALYLADKKFLFVEEAPSTDILPEGYEVKEATSNDIYTLYISQLPIIDIQTKDQEPIIDNENYLFAQFKIIDKDVANVIESTVAIRQRGGSSLNFPKKSYRLEFRESINTNNTKNVRLLGMQRFDDDWNLQALYNEPLRLRSKVGFELWQQIHQPHYQDKEPEARSGIDMKYADVFINNKYLGIYCLTERIDRKQLKLKKYQYQMQGELYKGIGWGASTFKWLVDFIEGSATWSGFEYQYPDEIIPDWTNLYSFVQFVLESDKNQFNSQHANFFQIDNAVDYFIFLNLLRITDNTGKNIYIARYNQNEPYFYVPWDLDLSFGHVWSGESALQYKRDYTENMLTNGFYKRLTEDYSPDGFLERYDNRWNELRHTVVQEEHILSLFQSNYDYLYNNGAYHREERVWPKSFNIKGVEDEWKYLKEWLKKRITFMDNHRLGTSKEAVNAASSTISIRLDSDNCIHFAEITEPSLAQLFDIQGRLIKSTPIDATTESIPMEEESNGIYLLKVSNSNSSFTTKLLKR